MRRVPFSPDALDEPRRRWFTTWQRRADGAARAVAAEVAAGGPPQFRSGVWSDLKAWLLEHVFHGKCAYCEGRMVAQSHGAAEHYRPKGRISARNPSGRSVTVVHPDGTTTGYYWLAYNWRNLVPACDRCNSGDGKQDQFPIAGRRVSAPGQLADADDVAELDRREQPLLLHPYTDDPAQHLRFGTAGTIAPRDGSARGRETIAVCKLDRAALAEERQAVQEEVRTAVRLAFSDGSRFPEGFTAALARVREKYAGDRAEYSAVGLQEYDTIVEQVLAELTSGARRSAVSR